MPAGIKGTLLHISIQGYSIKKRTGGKTPPPRKFDPLPCPLFFFSFSTTHPRPLFLKFHCTPRSPLLYILSYPSFPFFCKKCKRNGVFLNKIVRYALFQKTFDPPLFFIHGPRPPLFFREGGLPPLRF